MEGLGVLVVDDDPQLLKLAKSFLEREGVEVHCATNGCEAIRLVGEKSIALMITDFRMPGMQGIELAGRIREIDPELPIFMITGDASSEIHSLALGAGILRVFEKPIHFRELLESARRAIRERKARGNSA
jgi:two-component system C4-dicarboxylate transport response regulator DctD